MATKKVTRSRRQQRIDIKIFITEERGETVARVSEWVGPATGRYPELLAIVKGSPAYAKRGARAFAKTYKAARRKAAPTLAKHEAAIDSILADITQGAKTAARKALAAKKRPEAGE